MAQDKLMSGEPREPPEFESYAESYDGGMDQALKKISGKNIEDFMDLKCDRLLSDLKSFKNPSSQIKLLDFGCGTGLLLNMLSRKSFLAEFFGCDISKAMMEEAKTRKWPGAFPKLSLYDGVRFPYEEASFDVVLSICVFHHIPLAERKRNFAEIFRVLRPGGRAYIFEHNPNNPVTRYVVSKTPIDKNAILLKSSEVTRGFQESGLVNPLCENMMFFPPRWKSLRPLEKLLKKLPLGGQYMLRAEKKSQDDLLT